MRKKLILASGSPRRTELLKQIDLTHTIILANVDEKIEGSHPDAIVRSLSLQKCRAVAEQLCEEAVVIGADTVVALDGEILGKPASVQEAEEMITRLQGRTHEVYTGVTLIERSHDDILRQKSFHVCTEVHVLPMTEAEIRWYAQTGEAMDKAGAYGAQGAFARFIDCFRGDYFNVMGLPVHAVYQELKEWNFFEE